MTLVTPRAVPRVQAKSGSQPLRRMALSWTGFAVVLVAVPFAIVDPAARFVAITALLYSMLAMSWNLTLGVAGIANFAHMAFWAVGAYASAIATTRWHLSPWLALLFAAACAAACGGVAFIPVLRLRGIYIALVTFVFAQLCFFIVLNQRKWTGGSSGIVGLRPFTLGGSSLGDNGKVGYYFLAAGLFLVLLVLCDVIFRSPFGRGLIALRDHEEYAVCRGVPPFRQHLFIFVISAAMAGATGSVWAHFIGVVSPEMFGFGYSALVLSMIFLGGVSSSRGPIAGAIVIAIVSDHLKDQGPWRFIVVSLIIMCVLWFFPRGLAGLWESAVARVKGLRRRMADG